MQSKTIALWAVGILLGSSGLLSNSPILAQAENTLTYGMTVDGAVTSRRGEEWLFRGCAGEVVTIALASEEFDPYLELYGPTSNQSLAENDDDGDNAVASISDFVLPASGEYAIIAAGSNASDRGDYQLTLDLADEPVGESSDLLLLPADQPQTDAVDSRRGDEWHFHGCARDVVTISLDSAKFTPYLELYGPTRRASLIEAKADLTEALIDNFTLPTTGDYTVVAAGSSVRDRGDYDLTLSFAKPKTIARKATPTRTPIKVPTRRATATATATATPTPTATPQPVSQLPRPKGILIQAPGFAGPLSGNVYMDPNSVVGNTDATSGDPIVVRDQFYLELLVVDPEAATNEDDGIDRVEFNIFCPDGDYQRTERTARYCAFGGGEPDCNVVRLEFGQTLPDSSCEIRDDFDYGVSINAFPDNDPDGRSGNWNFTLRFQLDNGAQGSNGEESSGEESSGGTTSGELIAQFAQTSADDFLVFQVEAFDTAVGSNDGDGIDYVYFQIDSPTTADVYHRQEENAHYCAFGGGEPDCGFFSLSDNTHWPDGAEIESGEHILYAIVHANNGQETQLATTFTIFR